MALDTELALACVGVGVHYCGVCCTDAHKTMFMRTLAEEIYNGFFDVTNKHFYDPTAVASLKAAKDAKKEAGGPGEANAKAKAKGKAKAKAKAEAGGPGEPGEGEDGPAAKKPRRGEDDGMGAKLAALLKSADHDPAGETLPADAEALAGTA